MFYLNYDLQLLNVQNRETVILKSFCGSKTKLAFRYFGINCTECIQNVIKILQYTFKDDFYFDVVLLNDSYLKTYMNDLTNSNEYYVKNLNNDLEESGLPYFFIISPGSKIDCKVVLVPDVNDLKSTEEDIKALVK